MDQLVHIQGDESSPLTPLILIHAISGLALPYLALGPLDGDDLSTGRPVYGLSSPLLTSSRKPFTYLPTSLSALASQYVSLIQQKFLKGPYLLGGWSMGGMIAMEMTSILRSQGETVLHVLMIDSVNPPNYPKFVDRQEHEIVSRITYNAIACRLGASSVPLTIEEDDPDGANSEENSSAETSAENSDDEDWDDDMEDMLRKMRKHIHWGLSVLSLASWSQTADILENVSTTPVTLIKCVQPSPIPADVRDGRRKVLRKLNMDSRLGWPTEKFEDFRTVRFGATHDSCFDVGFVDELTRLMRLCLADVRE